MQFLDANDIATKIYYPVPIPLQKCYKSLNYAQKDLPNSVAASNTALALPIYPELAHDQIEYVAAKIREFFANGAH